MKREECTIGEIYEYSWLIKGGKRSVILLFDNPTSNSNTIVIQEEKFKTNGNFSYECDFQEATQEEKTWLWACIREGKFIPREEALKHYYSHQIY
jgi:hypothetical protein